MLRLLAHSAVFGTAFLMLVPFAWMALTSLKNDTEALSGSGLLPADYRWENYSAAWTSAGLHRYYINSILVAVFTTLLGVSYNALAGYAFAKLRFRGRRVLLGTTLATMLMPPSVYFVLAYVLCARLGLVDNLPALIVPFIASGFGILYMRQAIRAVPDDAIEAGRLDGMNEADIFWHVVRPAIAPPLAALAVITFMNSWNSFFWPLVMIDRDRFRTLPLALADLASGQYVQSWPVRMAAAMILTVPPVVVFITFQRAFLRGFALPHT
ncbi:MAG: carbohydrate ABC transporter permease [Phycisphaerae bacterium]|nr:carbohydrate ABC transporter permease [Phycisphaerae bacterium]